MVLLKSPSAPFHAVLANARRQAHARGVRGATGLLTRHRRASALWRAPPCSGVALVALPSLPAQASAMQPIVPPPLVTRWRIRRHACCRRGHQQFEGNSPAGRAQLRFTPLPMAFGAPPQSMSPTTHSGVARPMLLGPRQGRVAHLLWSSLGVPVFRTSAPPLAAYAQWRNLSACRSHSTADHRWPVRSVPRDCLPRLRANARRIGRTFAPLAALWGVRQPGVAMCRLVLGWRGARGHHVAAAAAARRLGTGAPGKTKAAG
eukprot:GEMP01008723.1.p1 GENE.GEMP01008723.1~~GEMP01008723.1.p1  ORF type:complete len:261 (+),score=65.19 GEMP01008723.1:2029-2811(+)